MKCVRGYICWLSSELVTDQCNGLCTDYFLIGENREERKIHQDIAETDNEQSNHHGSGEIPKVHIHINTCTLKMIFSNNSLSIHTVLVVSFLLQQIQRYYCLCTVFQRYFFQR